jgi:hypothetical protein
VFVEAPVGESRGRHQLGHPDSVVATLPEQGCGGFDDAGPVLLNLCLGCVIAST